MAHKKKKREQCNTIHTIVSRLLAAVPVHLPIILSIHFLWMAALHSGGEKNCFGGAQPGVCVHSDALF